MEQSPVSFPVWSLPLQEEEPHDVPHIDHQRRVLAVSVHHGQPFDKGPGAIVTSYDPQLACIDMKWCRETGRSDVLLHGPLALGTGMVQRFTEVFAPQAKPAPTEADHEPELRYPAQDTFIRCGLRFVPALRLDIGIPEATVIVSADLLSHPIVIGFWRWRVEMPMLDEVSFN